LRKNLYGTPPAGNAWATLRDRRLIERLNIGLWQCTKSVMDPTLFYIRHGGFKLTERRLTKRSTKRGDLVYYEDFNPKDFDSFNGTEFDIISRVTLNREFPSDPDDKIKFARGWGPKKEQVVFENSKPLQLEHATEKLEDDPEVTRVFEKKLHKRWGSVPVDMVTEFTYMDVMDTGTPLNEAWVSIHTDDLDSAGTNKEILDNIFKEVDDEWSLKETPSDFMLGVKRTSVYDKQGALAYIEHTMTAYVLGAAESFREHLPTKTLNDPFPEGLYLSKLVKAPEEEIKRNQAKGYLRAVGMIMWAVRGVFFTGKYGAQILCSMMGCPSDKAFAAAMHMLAYMEQHSNQGIKYSADGNPYPIISVDASNKPDGDDGCAIAGHIITMMDGPLVGKSYKHKHNGLSSEQNEYMAITGALRVVVWMRQLFNEIGLSELTAKPWSVYADNVQANRICKEEFVSAGNQHIYMPYHYNREVVKLGHVIIKWVQSKYNLSDIMTKPVASAIINELGPILLGYGGFKELIDRLETSPRELTEKACRELGGISSQSISTAYIAYSNPPSTWTLTPSEYINRSLVTRYRRMRKVSNKDTSHGGWGNGT
jgi:hypothetical protein